MTALVLGISTSITTIQKWQKDQQARQELEQDKVTSELSFLKAQINPHFFFNTFNNVSMRSPRLMQMSPVRPSTSYPG